MEKYVYTVESLTAVMSWKHVALSMLSATGNRINGSELVVLNNRDFYCFMWATWK